MPNIGDYRSQIYILQRWHYSEGYTTAARNARTPRPVKPKKLGHWRKIRLQIIVQNLIFMHQRRILCTLQLSLYF